MLPTTPPTSDVAAQRKRQALTLKFVIGILLVSAGVFAFLLKGLALPLRLMIASMDVSLAAVLWLVLHQKFRK